jgi:hypothetical protein
MLQQMLTNRKEVEEAKKEEDQMSPSPHTRHYLVRMSPGLRIIWQSTISAKLAGSTEVPSFQNARSARSAHL